MELQDVTPGTATAPREDGSRGTRIGTAIKGLGAALPDGVVPNEDFLCLGVDDEWLRSRTGILERRTHPAWLDGVVDLGTAAAQAALDDAGVAAEEVDLVVLSTISALTIVPTASVQIAGRLGAVNAGTVDLGAGCNAWISSVALGAGLIESGRARTVLVIGSEHLTRMRHADPKRTAHLPGDGAGAAVLGAVEGESRIGPVLLRSDSSEQVMEVRHDVFAMDGPAVFGEAVPRMASVTREAVDASGLTLDDIDLFVMHQANARITQAVGRRLKVEPGRVVDCIARMGNTSSASIPLALAEARRDGRLRDGSRVVLAAFAGGLVWGGTVVRWGADG